MKNKHLYVVAISGMIAVAAMTPSCKPDEKPCDTAMQDSLNVREMRLKEREMSLREREMAIAERERSLGISAGSTDSYSGASGTTSAPETGDQAGMKNKPKGRNSTDPKGAAYKAPALAFPGQYPESSERTILDADVQHQTTWGKKVMLNEIYARHGYVFTDADLKKHFAQESWYKGTEKNMSKLNLTPLERQNIAFIKQHQ